MAGTSGLSDVTDKHVRHAAGLQPLALQLHRGPLPQQLLNCVCTPTNTCGTPPYNLNDRNGGFHSNSNSNAARCRGTFQDCVCTPTNTCGTPQAYNLNSCDGTLDPNTASAVLRHARNRPIEGNVPA